MRVIPVVSEEAWRILEPLISGEVVVAMVLESRGQKNDQSVVACAGELPVARGVG